MLQFRGGRPSVSYRTLGQAGVPVNWTSKTISIRRGRSISMEKTDCLSDGRSREGVERRATDDRAAGIAPEHVVR